MHHRVMKFTRDGKLVMTIGQYDKNAGSNDTTLLGGPAGIWVDPQDQRGLHRRRLPQPPRHRLRRRDRQVPAPLGRLRREAGRHGEVRPEDDGERRAAEAVLDRRTASPDRRTARSTSPTAAATASRCSTTRASSSPRRSSRRPRSRRARRSCIVLSPDPQQQWLYLADGTNHKVWILRRSDLEIVGEFGRGGRQVGQFLRPHGMSIDARAISTSAKRRRAGACRNSRCRSELQHCIWQVANGKLKSTVLGARRLRADGASACHAGASAKAGRL